MNAVQRIDPTPEGLQDALRAAVSGATPDGGPPLSAPDWTTLEEKGNIAEGQTTRRFNLDGGYVLDIQAVRWTDAIGRKHWRIAADYGPSSKDGLRAFSHPLVAFAPPFSCGWRDGTRWRREILVHCVCGAVGTPVELGWVGRACGACHAREQRGLPSHRPRPGHVALRSGHPCHVLADGRVAFIRVKRSAGPELAIGVWASPDAAAPEWESPCGPNARLLTAGGGFIALSEAGGISFLTEGGAAAGRLTPNILRGRWPTSAFFVGQGPASLLLVSDRGEASLFPMMRSGEVMDECRIDDAGGQIHGGVGTPTGDHFLLSVEGGALHGVQRRELHSGLVADLLEASDGRAPYWTCGLPDGAVIGILWGAEGWTLTRWPSGGPVSQAKGRGPERRAPEMTVSIGLPSGMPAAAPDGEIALVEDGEIVARCAKTLLRRASFRPDGVTLQGYIGFSGGRLLALTDKGTAVWPWRELMGKP